MERKYRIKTFASPDSISKADRWYKLQKKCKYVFRFLFITIPYYKWELIRESNRKKELCDYAKEKGFALI